MLDLIKACQSKNDSFNIYAQHYIKDPLKFFKNKNLEKEFLSLSTAEQDNFKNPQKFFDLLVKLKLRTLKDNNIRNIEPYCRNCKKEVSFISLGFGYQSFCSDECKKEYKSKIQTEIENSRTEEEKAIISQNHSFAYNKLTDEEKLSKRLKQSQSQINRSPEEKLKQKLKIRSVNEASGYWTPREQKEDFDLYRLLVAEETNKSVKKHYYQIKDIEKRSLDFQLDHIFSIKDGFSNGVLPWVIGHYKNLQIITRSENASKNRKSHITKTELFEAVLS